MTWKTENHLTQHYRSHRHEFPGYSREQYDLSAHETVAVGTPFDYVDPLTDEDRVGYFDRQRGRFTATTLDGLIVTHFVADEDYVASLSYSDYDD
jgi:hypothetical protein